jgi:SAM-dependent methyltransferase
LILLSNYDTYAKVYDGYASITFYRLMSKIYRNLITGNSSNNSSILDVCCGTGVFAKGLNKLGYQVSGIDNSVEMLALAKENAPDCQFILGNVLNPDLYNNSFDGVISTFDSVNHFLNSNDLNVLFSNIAKSLKENGIFVFDLTVEEGFIARWNKEYTIFNTDSVIFDKMVYSEEIKTGRNFITLFIAQGDLWKREDVTIIERCYDVSELKNLLTSAGFKKIEIFDVKEDFGLHKEVGRAVFLCRK